MNLQQAIRERRTVHRYRPEPIPDGAVERALGAAVLAPNHKLTFPWRFTRVGRSTRERLADLAVDIKCPPGQTRDEARVASIRAKILNPAELIVVSLVRTEDPIVAREDYASASCAIQNLSLSLWAEGVGTKWSSGKLTMHGRAYEACGIDAATEEIIAFVWAGVPDAVPDTPPRPALDDLVRELP